jgi:two-component system, cell cycle sensor histidine kinase and response regulator CckA
MEEHKQSKPVRKTVIKRTAKRSILFRTTLFTWAVVALSLGLFVLLIIPYQKRILEEELASRAESVATSIAQVTATALITGDYSFVIDHCIEVVKERSSIVYIVITRKDGFSLIISRGKWKKAQLGGFWRAPTNSLLTGQIIESGFADSKVFHLAYPFRYLIDWGWIHIGLSLDKHHKDLQAIYVRTFLICLACLAGGLIISFYYARMLGRPILLLNSVTHNIREGDLSARALISTGDELESLSDSLNEMAATLQKSQAELKEAHDRLEVRVKERTAELETSNELLMSEIGDRMRAEESLTESEERYRTLMNNMPEAIFTIDLHGNFTFANPACVKLTGYSMDQILTMNMLDIAAPEFHDLIKGKLARRRQGETVGLPPYEVEILDSNGNRYVTRLLTSALYDKVKNLIGIQGIASDITVQKSLEKQLLHAQKMESIGTLAGGVAHDFNNLLTVILGNLDLAKMDIPETHPQRPLYDNMAEAGLRAKDLIKQLLQFGRPAPREERVISLNALVDETSRFLRPLIPSTIEIERRIPPTPSPVKADPSLISQILANLSVNARDAMPEGGRLRLEVSGELIDDEYCKAHIEAKPGMYCVLTVADTGLGMKPEVRDRIFEPFFTTKERGSGTGLGLSIVYGIMKQLEGWIQVESEVGAGTIFKLFFPRAGTIIEETMKQEQAIKSGDETVLLADDEKMILSLGKRILEKCGYKVITARDAREAIELYGERKDAIDLVILDLTMPEGGGIRAFKEIRALSGTVPIIISSGYLAGMGVDEVEESISAFLPKPFSAEKMTDMVRQVLDGKWIEPMSAISDND